MHQLFTCYKYLAIFSFNNIDGTMVFRWYIHCVSRTFWVWLLRMRTQIWSWAGPNNVIGIFLPRNSLVAGRRQEVGGPLSLGLHVGPASAFSPVLSDARSIGLWYRRNRESTRYDCANICVRVLMAGLRSKWWLWLPAYLLSVMRTLLFPKQFVSIANIFF